jgi:hypothetical protein
MISITASSLGKPRSHPLPQVADFENQHEIEMKSEAHSSIYHHFNDVQVKVIHDSIRFQCDFNSSHLCS